MPEHAASSIAAVRKSVIVPATPGSAFELFTTGFGGWWPLATHSVGTNEGLGKQARRRDRTGWLSDRLRSGDRPVRAGGHNAGPTVTITGSLEPALRSSHLPPDYRRQRVDGVDAVLLGRIAGGEDRD